MEGGLELIKKLSKEELKRMFDKMNVNYEDINGVNRAGNYENVVWNKETNTYFCYDSLGNFEETV